jgi:tRNA pseudouridine55 synthase
MNNFFFSVFKPRGVSSLDVVKKVRRMTTEKVGHVGTLDPFASGLLLVAVGKATKLNNYIHDLLPKTYLAIGKLGVATDTGDVTGNITGRDESKYVGQLAAITSDVLQDRLRQKFLGSYQQAPHQYSAAKFMGKRLHQYAREGVTIVKPKTSRTIFDLQVVKFSYPYLSMRFTVSSGTYIRTLFSECANYLGTLGMLIGLGREAIGQLNTACDLKHLGPIDPETILLFPRLGLSSVDAKYFANGNYIDKKEKNGLYWAHHDERILGLGRVTDNVLRVEVNFTRS